MTISSEHKSLEEMGEARVRQLCSGDVYGNNNAGIPDQLFKISALIWLSELDVATRKRAER